MKSRLLIITVAVVVIVTVVGLWYEHRGTSSPPSAAERVRRAVSWPASCGIVTTDSQVVHDARMPYLARNGLTNTVLGCGSEGPFLRVVTYSSAAKARAVAARPGIASDARFCLFGDSVVMDYLFDGEDDDPPRADFAVLCRHLKGRLIEQ